MEKDLQVLIEKALAAGASAARVVDVSTIAFFERVSERHYCAVHHAA